MKKRNILVLCVTILLMLLITACEDKVERVEPQQETKKETEKSTSKQNKEKTDMEEGILPDDVFDESDAHETVTEEQLEESFQEILDEHKTNDGPLILPDDEF